MKKLTSIILALVLVLSLSTVAFAAEDDSTLTMTSAPASYTSVIKAYELVGSTDDTLYPAETLKFTSTADAANPDNTNLTVSDLVVAGNSNQNLTINVPAFSEVGTYHFTIAETAGSTQGVTYTTGTIAVSVLVTYDYDDEDNDGYGLKATVGITADGTTKEDTFTNTYSVGSLNVKKTVSGNLASKEQEFSIDVTFEAEGAVLSTITVGNGTTIAPSDWADDSVTVTVTLKHDQDVTFSNIPAGVTYTVVEQSKHSEVDANGSDTSKGYTVTYTNSTGTIDANDADNAVINNEKGTNVDTGIFVDSLPYVMMLAIAAFGLVLFFSKKRLMREN